MQLYQGEPAPGAGDSGELGNGRPGLAPYPVLLRVPYMVERDEPLPTRAVKTPAAPTYLDSSNPPPVRMPRPEAAPAPAVPTPAVAKPQPPAKPTPWQPRPGTHTPPAPETHGWVAVGLLLLVIAGLCAHWQWAALAPYCKHPHRVLDLVQGRACHEMVVVPAEGTPMLTEPVTPTPASTPVCREKEKTRVQAAPADAVVSRPPEPRMLPASMIAPSEAALPPSPEPVVTGPTEPAAPGVAPIEPGSLPESIVTKPTETAVAKPTEPITPVSATILEPQFEMPVSWTPVQGVLPQAAPEPEPVAAPVEAELGFENLPTEEGSKP